MNAMGIALLLAFIIRAAANNDLGYYINILTFQAGNPTVTAGDATSSVTNNPVTGNTFQQIVNANPLMGSQDFSGGVSGTGATVMGIPEGF